jgi:glyoxylase I family protein
VRLHHLALRVADVERALGFYGGVLGLAEIERHHADGRLRSIWLAADDVVLMIELALRGRPAGMGSGHLLCFAIDDLGAWEARLAEAGVVIEDRTPSTLYVSDPDGHRVGLSVYVF